MSEKARNTHESDRTFIQNLVWEPEETGHLEDPCKEIIFLVNLQ